MTRTRHRVTAADQKDAIIQSAITCIENINGLMRRYYIVVYVIFLGTILVAFSIIGGLLFRIIEYPPEKKVIEAISRQRASTLTQLRTKIVNGESRAEITLFVQLYEAQYIGAIRNGTVLEANKNNELWTLEGSVYYCVTTFTLLGYGNLAPKTDLGRVIAVIYCGFTVPMTSLINGELGEILLLLMNFWWNVFSILLTKEDDDSDNSSPKDTKAANSPTNNSNCNSKYTGKMCCIRQRTAQDKQFQPYSCRGTWEKVKYLIDHPDVLPNEVDLSQNLLRVRVFSKYGPHVLVCSTSFPSDSWMSCVRDYVTTEKNVRRASIEVQQATVKCVKMIENIIWKAANMRSSSQDEIGHSSEYAPILSYERSSLEYQVTGRRLRHEYIVNTHPAGSRQRRATHGTLTASNLSRCQECQVFSQRFKVDPLDFFVYVNDLTFRVTLSSSLASDEYHPRSASVNESFLFMNTETPLAPELHGRDLQTARGHLIWNDVSQWQLSPFSSINQCISNVFLNNPAVQDSSVNIKCSLNKLASNSSMKNPCSINITGVTGKCSHGQTFVKARQRRSRVSKMLNIRDSALLVYLASPMRFFIVGKLISTGLRTMNTSRQRRAAFSDQNNNVSESSSGSGSRGSSDSSDNEEDTSFGKSKSSLEELGLIDEEIEEEEMYLTGESDPNAPPTLPTLLSLGTLFVYIGVGAGVLSTLSTQLSYFDSFWFIFISLCTIGYGDVVPVDPILFLMLLVYLFIGMSLMSNVIAETSSFFSSNIKKTKAIATDAMTIASTKKDIIVKVYKSKKARDLWGILRDRVQRRRIPKKLVDEAREYKCSLMKDEREMVRFGFKAYFKSHPTAAEIIARRYALEHPIEEIQKPKSVQEIVIDEPVREKLTWWQRFKRAIKRAFQGLINLFRRRPPPPATKPIPPPPKGGFYYA